MRSSNKFVFVILPTLFWVTSGALAQSPVVGKSTTQNTPGVFGDNAAKGRGVFGNAEGGDGVFGFGGGSGRGVVGVSGGHTGVEGNTDTGIGVFGSSTSTGRGVVGVTKSTTAVEGNSDSGPGVFGTTKGAKAAGGSLITRAVAI
ncbi:MAG: hypothetical protein M3Z96_09395 [Pseudomonadota bacterium]|nr:hypothetical protein [Pseudomonadota bacterium]